MKVKVKNKTDKSVVITIERVYEETTTDDMTENRTLFYLINAEYSGGRGIGFRAESQIDAWSKMMKEIYL